MIVGICINVQYCKVAFIQMANLICWRGNMRGWGGRAKGMFSSNGLEFPRGPCLGRGLFLSQKNRQEKDPVRVPGEHRGTNHSSSCQSLWSLLWGKQGRSCWGGEAAESESQAGQGEPLRSENGQGTRRGRWFCVKPRGVWPHGEKHVVKVRESERRWLKVKSSHMPSAWFQRWFSPPLPTRSAYSQSSCLNLDQWVNDHA